MPLQLGRNVLWRQGIDIVMIQPQQFIGIERTGRLTYRTQSKELNHLFTAEDLLIAVGPAQTHQIVEQGFRQIAVVTVLHHADCAMTFGKFFTVVAVDHRHVRINRDRCIQRFKNVDLAWRVIDMVFATHDVGDRHIPVIYHNTEVIGR